MTESLIPDSLLRFFVPPWGGRADERRAPCTRKKVNGGPCQRDATEWPEGFVRYADPAACWSHLNNAEQAWALEARDRHHAAFRETRHRHLATHSDFRICSVCHNPGYAVETGAEFWGRITDDDVRGFYDRQIAGGTLSDASARTTSEVR